MRAEAAERGSNRWRENERASDLLSEQFTAHTAPQFGAGVGVSFDGWRIIHAAVLLHALTHRVQITVRHHDLCHPDCVPLAAAHEEREGHWPQNTRTIPNGKTKLFQIVHSKLIKNMFLENKTIFSWSSQENSSLFVS